MSSRRSSSCKSLQSAASSNTSAKSEEKERTTGLLTCLFAFLIYQPIFAALLSWAEGTTYGQSLYVCIQIAATVGFGDIPPQTDAGKLIIIIGGLGAIPQVLISLQFLGMTLFHFVECALDRTGLVSCAKGKFTLPKYVFCAALFLCYMFCCVALFKFYEADWTWVDCIYFVFVCFSTVGFGDYIPSDWTGPEADIGPYQVMQAFFFLFGLAFMAMIFNLIMLAHEKVENAAANVGFHVLKSITNNHNDGIAVIRKKFFAMMYIHAGESWEDLFDLLDSDETGDIDFEEFVTFSRNMLQLSEAAVSDEQLKQLFEAVDVDGSGGLVPEELARFLDEGTGPPNKASRRKEDKENKTVEKTTVTVEKTTIEITAVETVCSFEVGKTHPFQPDDDQSERSSVPSVASVPAR